MILIVILLVISMSKITYASTITLNETNGGLLGDTYTNNESSTAKRTNYGTATSLQNREYLYLNNRWIWMLWNMSVVPAGSTITSAIMSLYQDSSDLATQYNPAYNTSLENSTGWEWTEALTTRNRQPTNIGVLQQNATITTTLEWKNWTITNASITAYNNATNQNLSIVIKATNISSTGWTLYRSKEHANTTTRPQLVITYTTASGTQYNLTGNESMTLTFGATRQLIAKRTGTKSMTLALASYKAKTVENVTYYSIVLNETNNGNIGDSWITDLMPNSNYGSQVFLWTNGYTVDIERMMILWDLSSISSTATITNAYVSMWHDGGITAKRTLAYNTTNNWTETNITWNNQTILGTLQDNITTTNSYVYENWTVTDSINNQIKQDSKILSILFKDNNETLVVDDAIAYYSKENTNTTQRPQLYITYYVPTPSGNTSNGTGSLSMSFTSNDYRKLNASRTDSLSMSLIPTKYRTANLKRTTSLTMTLTESAIKSMVSIYQRLASLSMILSSSSNRIGILNRLDSLTFSFVSNTYKNAFKLYSRLAQLSMSFADSTYRKAILNRARSLLITIISGRSIYTPPVVVTEQYYQVCAAKFQFGDTPIFLCVFGDGTWKLFIVGADLP